MPSSTEQPEILCINTGGVGDLHGLRMRRLAGYLDRPVVFYDLDRNAKKQAFRDLREVIRSRRWRLIYQESTGIAGGLNLLLAPRDVPFIFSSGDPISGFFRATKGPLYGKVFEAYERALFRACAGFIGWTPYLAGRALEMGARRAVTIEGAVDMDVFRPLPPDERRAIRAGLGIPPDKIVCGLVGSIKWVPRQSYCYGLELVEAARRITRPDMVFLIVGDGDGRALLEQRLTGEAKQRVIFTGRLPEAEVARAMNAMDLGFITQTLDCLGSYRLTTKLPEYLGCGTPVAMSPIPGYFDYAETAGWALPPLHPASSAFHDQLAAWLNGLTREEIEEKARHGRAVAQERFTYNVVGPRFASFVENLLTSGIGAAPAAAAARTVGAAGGAG
jgi:Glycosyltransferase